jgi:hypothetical protein
MKHISTRYFATNSPASSRQAHRDGIKPVVLPSLAKTRSRAWRVQLIYLFFINNIAKSELGHGSTQTMADVGLMKVAMDYPCITIDGLAQWDT